MQDDLHGPERRSAINQHWFIILCLLEAFPVWLIQIQMYIADLWVKVYACAKYEADPLRLPT